MYKNICPFKPEYRFDEDPITRIMNITVLRGLASDGTTPVGSVNSITTIGYLLLPGTAQIGQDFRGPGGLSSGQLTFGTGQRSISLNVQVMDDAEPEMEELFQVSFKYVVESLFF